jgi:hypothetical protein
MNYKDVNRLKYNTILYNLMGSLTLTIKVVKATGMYICIYIY